MDEAFGDDLMANSEQLKAIVDMASGVREHAIQTGYSAEAAEEMAVSTYCSTLNMAEIAASKSSTLWAKLKK